MEYKLAVSVPLLVPVMDWHKFCELAGLESGVVQAWVYRGLIPTVKIGRHRLVDLVGLAEQVRCMPKIQEVAA